MVCGTMYIRKLLPLILPNALKDLTCMWHLWLAIDYQRITCGQKSIGLVLLFIELRLCEMHDFGKLQDNILKGIVLIVT